MQFNLLEHRILTTANNSPITQNLNENLNFNLKEFSTGVLNSKLHNILRIAQCHSSLCRCYRKWWCSRRRWCRHWPPRTFLRFCTNFSKWIKQYRLNFLFIFVKRLQWRHFDFVLFSASFRPLSIVNVSPWSIDHSTKTVSKSVLDGVAGKSWQKRCGKNVKNISVNEIHFLFRQTAWNRTCQAEVDSSQADILHHLQPLPPHLRRTGSVARGRRRATPSREQSRRRSRSIGRTSTTLTTATSPRRQVRRRSTTRRWQRQFRSLNVRPTQAFRRSGLEQVKSNWYF